MKPFSQEAVSMKKSIIALSTIAAVLLFSAAGARAQEWATSAGSCFAKGDKIIDVGIPVPFFQLGVHGAFDYGFHDCISGGGGFGFRHTYWSDYDYFTFLGRAAFHPFNLAVLQDKIKVRDKLDTYAGLTFFFGAGMGNYPDWGVREYIGARWHFSPKISCFLEDCAGFGYLDGGISFNF
jgi:hypothetical protein